MKREFDLIGDIYDAVLEHRLWPRVLQNICEVGEADKAVFVATDILNPRYNLAFIHGYPVEALHEYRDGGYDRLELEFMGKHWMHKLPLGEPSSSTHVWGSADAYRAAGGAYVEFLNRWGVYHQAPVQFELSDFRFVAVGLNNGLERPFTDAHLAFMRRIGPHLRRAMQVHRQLTEAQQENSQLYAALDLLLTGVVLLNVQGRIAYANPAAEKLLRQHDGLQVGQDGLKAHFPEQQPQLQKLIRGAIETSQRDCQGDTGGVISLKGRSRSTPLMLTVMPLSQLEDYQELRSNHIAAAVFLTDPEAGHQLSTRLLQGNFGLSLREIEICQHFVNMPVLEALAPQLGLTLSSLRSAFKIIYEKTGRHSQAELMRLLMGLRVNFEHIR